MSVSRHVAMPSGPIPTYDEGAEFMGKARKKLVKSKTKATKKVKKKRSVTKKVEPKLAKATKRSAKKPVKKPAEETPAKKDVPRHSTAEDMASRQREISVAEFFTKNRHLLGFDNPRKALLTTIKEGVDNSLDACEEGGILPEVKVVITPGKEEDRFIVTIEDNGPGILKKQIPRIFAKLLYGSKFHRLKMSRGQQGIGISAAGMYGQLTTGKPISITSKTSRNKPAHHYELELDTKRNEPRIIVDETVDWPVQRGTKAEIELEAKFQKGRQSVEEYLEQTAIANPHVSLQFITPNGETKKYNRASNELPVQTREIKPHPYGVELGVLIKMLHDTKARTLQSFLHSEFSRVSSSVARAICEKAKVSERSRPTRIARQEADNLFKAINQTKIEAGLAYGGSLQAEGLARVLRYANRVPLLYQQSACAMTRSVLNTAWRNYALSQSAGALPSGPLVIIVHMASVWVPFTSESKEAVAHYPEIIKETRLALQECGRRLAVFIRRRRKAAESQRKKEYIQQYIPHIAIALREMLELSERQETTIVKQLKDLLERSRS